MEDRDRTKKRNLNTQILEKWKPIFYNSKAPRYRYIIALVGYILNLNSILNAKS